MRKNKIRILHVAQAAGGVDRYIRMLLKYLDKEKFENILVCSQDFREEDYRGLVDSFEQIEMTRAIGASDLKAIKAVRKLIRKYNPDIVYAHSSKAGAIARVADIGLKNHCVYNPHGWAFNMRCSARKKAMYTAIERVAAPFCDKIICISDAEKRSALDRRICREDKLQVIFNGVDIEAYENGVHGAVTRKDLNIQEDAFVVGMVGRMSPQKAPDVFVKMAKKVKDAVPNAVIRDIKKKIALLFDWIAEAKVELAKPQAPDLVSLLNAYYTQRKAGAYSQKGKISNLKEMNDTFNYLRANGIYSLEDLERRVSEHSAATESLKKTLDEQTARMKAIKRLYDSSAAFQNLKPVYDGLQKIKFEKPRAKYKAEHEAELIQFYAARRKLTGEFPDGKVDMKKLSDEYDELEQAHETTYGEFKAVRDDLHRLWKVKSCVDTAARFNKRTEEQMLQNRPQTRHKKEDMTR